MVLNITKINTNFLLFMIKFHHFSNQPVHELICINNFLQILIFSYINLVVSLFFYFWGTPIPFVTPDTMFFCKLFVIEIINESMIVNYFLEIIN